ncbi:hypothetical protein BHE74_00001624 [Ensete ventricosum]|nr:hypothetical protein BHE74_00001624 [Ensete ventricosum]RZR77758.1 hypothetical protein BHM03_00002930 [Ensete ventricosum]
MHPSSVRSQDRVVKQSDREEEEGEIEVAPLLSRDEKGKKERIREPRAEGGVFIGDEGLVGGSRLLVFQIWAVLEPIRNASGSPISSRMNSTMSFSPREDSPKEAPFLLARRPPARRGGRSGGGRKRRSCGKKRHRTPFVCTGM